MQNFVKKCKDKNRRGVRYMTKKSLDGLLGGYASSPSHVSVARKLLKHLSGRLRDTANESENVEQDAIEQPTDQANRRQSRQAIARAGLVSDFDDSEIEGLAAFYKDFESKQGNRTAQSIQATAHMIHRFFTWAHKETGGSKSELQILLNSDLISEFGQVMSRLFKPNTVKNHAVALSNLIDVILWSREAKDLVAFHPQMKEGLKHSKEVWDNLHRKSQKSARALQREKTRSGKFQNAPILCILRFMMQTARNLGEEFSSQPAAKPTICELPKELLVCLSACYLAIHGQRLCAAQNLKLNEINDAKNVQGRFVVRIQKHKSFRFHGAAAIALRPHQYATIKAMAELYGHQGHAFPRVGPGTGCGDLLRPLQRHLTSRFSDLPPITFNAIRKTIESNKFLVSGGDRAKSKITSYLMHGRQVTELHYAFKTDENVVLESRLVEEVLSNLAVLDLIREGRVRLGGMFGKLHQ